MARTNMKKWFRQEVDAYYLETLSDGMGGNVQQWTRKYSKLPCRIFDFGSSAEFNIEEQGISYPVEKKLLCDIDTIISKGDRVTLIMPNEEDSNFMVLRVTKQQAFSGHHTSCLLGRMEDKR